MALARKAAEARRTKIAPQRRREIARNAAVARWAKERSRGAKR